MIIIIKSFFVIVISIMVTACASQPINSFDNCCIDDISCCSDENACECD